MRRTLILTDALHALAERLGVHVQWHTGGPKGLWVSTHRVITLREGMGHRKTRCTLAHELGHAVHNDLPPPDERTYRRQEVRADRWAAGALITTNAYEEAEALVGSHPGALALELGVTTHIIHTWRDLHAYTR